MAPAPFTVNDRAQCIAENIPGLVKGGHYTISRVWLSHASWWVEVEGESMRGLSFNANRFKKPPTS